ncbi:hypothetical protein KKF82_04320 [Patescibacteria group bacterium]|nr:hypothetical protein [Patescibacteria group bacterium]
MKHVIYPERQGTATTTSADANYPITNLTANAVRKKVWKAASGVQTATIRVPISANAEVISLHKTNAETAICTITLNSTEKAFSVAAAVDVGGGLVKLPIPTHGMAEGNIILINGTTNYDGVETLPTQAAGDANNLIITATYVAETFAITDTACIVVESTTHTLETATRTYDRFWQEYTQQAAAHTATIKLTAGTGETVEAGIVRAGDMLTLAGPLRSPGERPVSYSIRKELHSGAFYGKQLDIVRSFSYSMLLARETEYRDLMDLYRYYDPDPFAMLITDNPNIADDNQYAVFGVLDGEPTATHTLPKSTVGVNILEVV